MRTLCRTLLPLAGVLLFACSSDEPEEQKAKVVIAADADPTGQADHAITIGTAQIGGEPATATVEFRNQSGKTIEIGPFAVPVPFAADPAVATKVKSGGAHKVKFTFQPVRGGEASQLVTVFVDGEPGPTLRLVGEGTRLHFSCDRSVDFGTTVAGTATAQEVTCKNESEQAVTIKAEAARGQHADAFEVDLADQVVEAGSDITFPVTFLNEGGPGDYVAHFDVVAAGDVVRSTVQLTASSVATALEVSPGCGAGGLHLGWVRPGDVTTGEIIVRNMLSTPLEVTRLALEGDGANQFRILTDAPFTIAPDDPETRAQENEVAIAVEFRPIGEGPVSATLAIQTGDVSTTTCISGHAGGPALSCTPLDVAFGPVAVNASRTQSFTCTNVGVDDPEEPLRDNLLVEPFSIGHFAYSIQIENDDGTQGLKAAGYQAGTGFTTHITFRPSTTGHQNVPFSVVSNGGKADLVVTGEGRALQACDATIVGELQWGLVAPGESSTLEVALRNVGAGDCIVYGASLAGEGELPFTVGRTIRNLTLAAGAETVVPVTFAAPADLEETTSFAADLLFEVSNPTLPFASVEIAAAAGTSCLEVTPTSLAFDPVRTDCAPPTMMVEIHNTCAESRTVEGARFLSTPACSDDSCGFTVLSSLPTVIDADDVLEIEIEYLPDSTASDRVPLLLEMDIPAENQLVWVEGDGTTHGLQVDKFEAPATYVLSAFPVCTDDCDTVIQVAINGQIIPSTTFDETSQWSYDPVNNEVVFVPEYHFNDGDDVQIAYPVPCPADVI